MHRQLDDEQWRRIESMLPGKIGGHGRNAADNRQFVEAVLWIARTESSWRRLPAEFGRWNSVYMRFARWSRSGVWHRVFEVLGTERSFREAFFNSALFRDRLHEVEGPKKPSRKRSTDPAG